MDNRSGSPVLSEKPFPDLAALLRHRRVLESLVALPGREFTIRELSQESGVPYATTWRIVEALSAFGVLRGRRVGQSRAISLNATSPLLPPLRRLLALRLEPHREAARRFAKLASRLPDVRRAVLFGSSARGMAGSESDVDVAVVLDRRTEKGKDQIFKIAEGIQDQTGLRVIPITMTMREFEAGSRFARAVRAGEVLYDRACGGGLFQ